MQPENENETSKNVPVERQSRDKDVVDRFLEDDLMEPFGFLRNPRMFPFLGRNWFPRIDISETNDEVRVVADVPGADPDKLSIDIRDRTLTISGAIERETRSEKPYRFERTHGEFRREFMLPARVKEDQVRATYKNGILKVTLPKTEEEKRKKITIERE